MMSITYAPVAYTDSQGDGGMMSMMYAPVAYTDSQGMMSVAITGSSGGGGPPGGAGGRAKKGQRGSQRRVRSSRGRTSY